MLVGLVRITGDNAAVEAQHGALEPVCDRVFEERASRRRRIDNRPDLLLAQGFIEGLMTIHELFERGVIVKVLEGPSPATRQCSS